MMTDVEIFKMETIQSNELLNKPAGNNNQEQILRRIRPGTKEKVFKNNV